MPSKTPVDKFIVNLVFKAEPTFLNLIANNKFGISKHIARQIDLIQSATALFNRVLISTTIIQGLLTNRLNIQNTHVVINAKCGNNSIEEKNASNNTGC
ncbi:hypothetical protein GALL_39700 [mine drainage metagenome]|uniref:Uncharacterized protein n=1 Tax=mine drainage metagenome TaxID=410659 RepID=A0A1J5TU75_9ZZZZ